MSVIAYVGLGSNLDDPQQQVRRAAAALEKRCAGNFRMSSLYSSKAIGPGAQPDYVNAVAQFNTAIAARALLDELHERELIQGRVRTERWGARTLDLDLLLYGDAVIDEPGLQVPHPRLAERPFVLYPLLELAPALEIPRLGPLAALEAACPFEGIGLLDHA